jgi:DNA-binding XRE family transcriptional regulator
MPDYAPATFGTWLKTRRHTLDITQKELALKIDCAEITVRKIEANRLRPSKYLARVMLRKLRVPRTEQAELIQLARRRP